MLSELSDEIRNGSAVVCVLGLGRVGLPFATVLARSGLKVIGVDVDKKRIDEINSGNMPFYYPDIEEWLRKATTARTLVASLDSKRSVELSDVIVLTVGTPTGIQYQLDYTQLHSVLRELEQAGLRGKQIIMRSTSAPGTATDILLPFLHKKLGLQVGVDVGLAICPERIVEGQAHRELYDLPEIVGCFDELSAQIATELFRRINSKKHIVVTTPTTAELAKLFTNIYRYVNFALSNEFAIWAEKYGEDIQEIIRAANFEYHRASIPRPGFAGGPCLGKDGFLLDNGTTFSSIVSTAWKLNEAIPQHVVMSVMAMLGPLYGKKVGVLGLAFKADSDDIRMSPSVKLVESLKAFGAEVVVHDPHVASTQSLREAFLGAEIIIVATKHHEFRDIAPAIDASGCKVVYDVWGIYRPEEFKKARYMGLGRTSRKDMQSHTSPLKGLQSP